MFVRKHLNSMVLNLGILISVSGVGPKTGLAILNFGASEIIEAVQQADTSFFAAVPRVGKKLAQKIIIELRTKLGALKELDLGPVSPQRQEVLLALQSLGFDERSVHQVLQEISVEEMSLSEAVKTAIQLLGKK
jgi:holliday junction DNA helicase RuvA